MAGRTVALRGRAVENGFGAAGDDGTVSPLEGDTAGADVENVIGGSAGDTLTGNASARLRFRPAAPTWRRPVKTG